MAYLGLDGTVVPMRATQTRPWSRARRPRDTDLEVDPLGLLQRRMAQRCSYADGLRRMVLGDGAAWIWNL